ncbi:MAG: MCP four helix bundle domain-containing protein, partial [Nitrospirota bacterium]
MRLTISKKLIFGFLTVTLFIGLVGYFGINSINRLNRSWFSVHESHNAYDEITKLEAIVLEQTHEGMHLLSFEEEGCIEKFNPNYANLSTCHCEERSDVAISSLKMRFLASLGMTQCGHLIHT